MQSICKPIGTVKSMPAFNERNIYMHKTRMDNLILPHELMDYMTVISEMLKPLTCLDDVCYITIHEKRIVNESHRRCGVHVDFNWYEDFKSHGGAPKPKHRPSPTPGHSLYPELSYRQPALNGHGSLLKNQDVNGGMLLVSNYPACKIYNGVFNGIIGDGGCCKDIDLSKLEEGIMPANEVFFVNALGIHESLPIAGTVERSLVRINFHPDYIFNY